MIPRQKTTACATLSPPSDPIGRFRKYDIVIGNHREDAGGEDRGEAETEGRKQEQQESRRIAAVPRRWAGRPRAAPGLAPESGGSRSSDWRARRSSALRRHVRVHRTARTCVSLQVW